MSYIPKHNAQAMREHMRTHCVSMMRQHMLRTDVRTDALTQKDLRDDQSCGNATRAGGLKELDELTGEQTTARPYESSYVAGSVQNLAASPREGRTSDWCLSLLVALVRVTAMPFGVKRNAQGFSVRTLTNETIKRFVSCTNSASRRVQAHAVGAQRHHLVDEAVCSPVARWRGRSDGSDLLRAPTSFSAARSRMTATRFYRKTQVIRRFVGVLARVVRVVCGAARDAADAAELLDALGVLDFARGGQR